jgi:hypothetical protein
VVPSTHPSSRPSRVPSVTPTSQPSHFPSVQPTSRPSISPSVQPSGEPSVHPTAEPSTGASKVLPAPVLTSAIFSNDGLSVRLQFDAATNFGGTAMEFTCSSLFFFGCSAQSKCVWSDAKTVTAFISGDNCVNPGDMLSLQASAIIKAACPGGEGKCPNYFTWPKASFTKIVFVALPLNPVTPNIVLSLPALLGQCSPLLFDVSRSTGSSGRSFRNVSVTVHSPNSTQLQTFIQRNFQLKVPLLIPASYLTAGQTYNFVVTLCNFLKQCSQGSKAVIINRTILPSVSVPGSNNRTVGVHQSLSLSALASLSTCADDPTALTRVYPFTYNWQVLQGSTTISISSSTKDPSKFTIPAYSLQVNQVYTVKVTANLDGLTATTSMQVSTVSGNVVAVIAGASSQVVRIGSSITLDGTKSYDQNLKNAFGSSAGLKYDWSCVQVKLTALQTCENIFGQNRPLLTDHSSETIKLTALLTASAASEAVVTLTVRDTANFRSHSRVVNIVLLSPLSAAISLQSSSPSNFINPGQSLQLLGEISLPVGVSSAVLTWSSTGAVVNLNASALTPLTKAVTVDTSATSASSTTFSLKLSTEIFQGGFSYTFRLLCQLSSPGISTSSSINLAVNAPPTRGQFLVSPSEGIELSDLFTLSCTQWQDDHLPLQYSFGYLTTSGNRAVLTSLTQSSFKNTQLSAGLKSEGYLVNCFAEIFDNYLAKSTVGMVVTVKEKVLSSKQINSFLNQSSSAFTSNNADGIKQAAIFTSYLLNKVNCSHAPNCSSLYRLPCSSTAQTCGSCLSSDYFGITGDSNDPCFKSLEELSDYRRSNSTALKTCPGDCSDHGTCSFQSVTTNLIVEKCFESDLSCFPVCECDDGFTSSEICDLSDKEAASKMIYRENLINGIANLLELEDISENSITNVVNALNGATQATGELSSSGILLTLSLAKNLTKTVRITGLDVATIAGLLDALDSASSAVTNIENNRRRRRKLRSSGIESQHHLSDSNEEHSDSVLALREAVESYSSLVAASKLPGEKPQLDIKKNIRTFIQSHDLLSFPSALLSSSSSNGKLKSTATTAALCSSKVTVVLPQTTLEKSFGIQPNVMTVPACTSTGQASTALQIAATSFSNDLYGNSFDSDSMSLSLSSLPCSSPEDCTVMLTFRREDSEQLVVARSAAATTTITTAVNRPTFNVSCANNDFSVHNFSCPNTNRAYNITCRGKKEILQGKCPQVHEVPNCNILTGWDVAENSCVLVSYTSRNVTCRCLLRDDQSSTSTRRLLTNTTATNEVSVSYVSVLSAVTGNFETTVLSAGSLNDHVIEKGRTSIIIVGVLLGGILLAMALSHSADRKAQRIESSEREKKQHSHHLFSHLHTPDFLHQMTANNTSSKNITTKGNDIIKLAEDALPQILSSKSLTLRMKNELKRHHRWFGIIFFYCPKFPRLLRVVSIACNVIIMLFVQSLTYELTNGNDGSCERFTTEMTCLEDKSEFATGRSKCFWTPPAGTGSGECGYVQPDSSVDVIIFVAIFSAIVSTPFALICDRIILNILAAPSITDSVGSVNKKSRIRVDSADYDNNEVEIVPGRNRDKNQRVDNDEKETLRMISIQKKFESLTAELKNYREILLTDAERNEFDSKKNSFVVFIFCLISFFSKIRFMGF